MSMWEMKIEIEDGMPYHLQAESDNNPWFFDILWLNDKDENDFVTFSDDKGMLTLRKGMITAIGVVEVTGRCRRLRIIRSPRA